MGQQVWVAGTTAVDEDGMVVGPGDAEVQAAFIFNKIAKALGQAGASLNDVVRTRMFITSVSDRDAVGRAHAAVFAGIRPAATMVVISGLVDPRLLVEIEVDAYAA
jgi:enamine deaminase RidA (YjgF/YER057c/UK114 family)